MTGRRSAATDKALRLVAQGMSGYKAAKKCGLALSTVYRAIKPSRAATASQDAAAPRLVAESKAEEASEPLTRQS